MYILTSSCIIALLSLFSCSHDTPKGQAVHQGAEIHAPCDSRGLHGKYKGYFVGCAVKENTDKATALEEARLSASSRARQSIWAHITSLLVVESHEFIEHSSQRTATTYNEYFFQVQAALSITDARDVYRIEEIEPSHEKLHRVRVIALIDQQEYVNDEVLSVRNRLIEYGLEDFEAVLKDRTRLLDLLQSQSVIDIFTQHFRYD